MFHERTVDASKGKWRGVLLELGLPSDVLRDRHGPCPLCGGKDRFRFDNKEGSGSWFCNQCGAGSGLDLAMKFLGGEFRDVAARIDAILGNVKIDHDKPRPAISAEDRRTALRAVYAATVQAAPGDLVDAYLATRDLDEKVYPKALRFAAKLKDGDGGVRPAMVAMVTAPDGTPATMHRTFLKPDGSGKADMPSPRKMMPGDVPDGAAVRLCEWSSGCLGIAEGIETALAAGHWYEVPTWASLNAAMLAKWEPPAGCDDVAIFADNDANFTGQSAAYRLANRLVLKGVSVTVHIPETVGQDWADVWASRLRRPPNERSLT